MVLESRLSRCTICFSRAAQSDSPSSAPRRAMRTASEAVRSTRTGACGATTVVMSRPSTTTAGASTSFISCRCLAIRPSRSAPHEEIWEDTSVTSGVRIAALTSSAPTRTPGWSGSVDRSSGNSWAAFPSTASSFRSRSWFSTHHASARYVAPVSM